MLKTENRIQNKENKKTDRNRFIDFFSTKMFYMLFSFFFSLAANAQCAMCRAALAGDSNVKKAEAVNNGIVYLMVIPYLLVVVIGYLIYRMYQSKKKKAV
jgi:quinol-cytochrome oxidoreductase complex cytochrome b subunit